MKKLFPVLLAVSILLSLTSCSFHSSAPVAEARPVPASVLPEVSPAPPPVPEPSEPLAPSAPSAAPAQNVFHAETYFPAPANGPTENASHAETHFPAPAVPEHVHTWAPVTETVHHEAVTEQVKVIDQPGTEGHFEGGTYSVVVCRCGLEFRTGDEFLAHQQGAENLDLHGGYTSSVRSDQVWVEGTPEISHIETVTIRDAWDEELVTGEVCTSCGAVR